MSLSSTFDTETSKTTFTANSKSKHGFYQVRHRFPFRSDVILSFILHFITYFAGQLKFLLITKKYMIL